MSELDNPFGEIDGKESESRASVGIRGTTPIALVVPLLTSSVAPAHAKLSSAQKCAAAKEKPVC